MKRSILFSSLVILIAALSSCNDSGDSNFNNFNTTFASGVKTATSNNYSNWTGVPNIHFYTSDNVNYSNWTLEIGDATGYFSENITGVQNHWKGRVSHTDKDKWCNDVTYADSLQLDITNNESGWNDVVYRTTPYKSSNNNYFVPNGAQSVYYLKTDSAGNINSISVSDANHNYMFKFQTSVTDDFNTWKTKDMQDGWMNDQAKISMLLLPVLYTVFQQ